MSFAPVSFNSVLARLTHSLSSQCADAGDQPECSADRSARHNAGRRSFWSLCLFLMRKILGAYIVLQQNGNVLVPEALRKQSIHCVFRLRTRSIDAVNDSILSSHDHSPYSLKTTWSLL